MQEEKEAMLTTDHFLGVVVSTPISEAIGVALAKAEKVGHNECCSVEIDANWELNNTQKGSVGVLFGFDLRSWVCIQVFGYVGNWVCYRFVNGNHWPKDLVWAKKCC